MTHIPDQPATAQPPPHTDIDQDQDHGNGNGSDRLSYVGTMSRPASAEQEEKASSAMPATEVGRVRAERLDAGSVCGHRGRQGQG